MQIGQEHLSSSATENCALKCFQKRFCHNNLDKCLPSQVLIGAFSKRSSHWTKSQGRGNLKHFEEYSLGRAWLDAKWVQKMDVRDSDLIRRLTVDLDKCNNLTKADSFKDVLVTHCVANRNSLWTCYVLFMTTSCTVACVCLVCSSLWWCID